MNARLISVLGTLPDGRAGLVLKQHPDWTAIYSAASKLPTPLLRRIAELGKVHCFTVPGDVVWAAHDLPAVSVNRPGPRTITLPRPATAPWRQPPRFPGRLRGAGHKGIRGEMNQK